MKKRHTPDEIQTILREKIPEGLIVPEHTDYEHWYRHTPLDIKLPSVTTITSVLQSPHLKKWSAGQAVDYIEEHISQITSNGIPIDLRKAAIMAHVDTFEDAGGIGTEGHKVIENYLKDWMKESKQPDDIKKYIIGEDYRLWAIARSAQKFFNNYFAIPVVSEMKVAYLPKRKPTNGYAGTLDALMFLAFPVRESKCKCVKHDIAFKAGNLDELECMICEKKWKYEFTLVDFKTSNTVWKDEYLMQTAAYLKAINQMTGLKPKRIIIVRLDKAQEKYELVEVLKPSIAYAAFRHLKYVYDFLKMPEERKSFAVEGKEIINLNDL